MAKKGKYDNVKAVPSGVYFPVGFRFVYKDDFYEVMDGTGEKEMCKKCDLKSKCSDAPICIPVCRGDRKSVYFEDIKKREERLKKERKEKEQKEKEAQKNEQCNE